MKKLCIKCKKELDISFFWKRGNWSKDGLDTYCKNCRKEYQNDWLLKNREKRKMYRKRWYIKNKDIIRKKRKERQENNPDLIKKQRKKHMRTYILKTKYGITNEIFNRLVLKQQGKCAICGKNFEDCIPVVDHCHRTGKIRGILCHRCNLHLGFYEKDISFHKKAKNYLAYKVNI